ncbi:unnamed protein product [Paramecium sonneborni]|uniref:Uncharacterized protein n=1 Tax=Paramecium sonneborni TaxID=65129 RepID=A0A8S1RPZ8_9CILI|nr:unnamed protein product [Paramecium sonneborni]
MKKDRSLQSCLMLFAPFRNDIPQMPIKILLNIQWIPYQFLEKRIIEGLFILIYIRVCLQQMNLMPQMMRFSMVNDLGQDDIEIYIIIIYKQDIKLQKSTSLFKIIPQLLVELIGNSKIEGYQEFMLTMKRLFSLGDSITSVYSQQTMDDQIFKLFNLMVGNFIQNIEEMNL